MKENFKFGLDRVLSIFLTAIISAVIASLQAYLATKSIDPLPLADPVTAAMIGAVARTGQQIVKYS